MKASPFKLIILLLFSLPATAQNQEANHQELNEFLRYFHHTYEMGTYDELKILFPESEQKQLVEMIKQLNFPRKKGKAQIIEITEHQAIVFLTNNVTTPHSMAETWISSGLSGFYQAEKNKKDWQLIRKIPIDRYNRISEQNLDVVIQPEVRIKVTDILTIDILDTLGFWMTLNSKAHISEVRLNGQEIDFLFEGGVFLIKTPTAEQAQLVIKYNIKAEDLNYEERPYFGNDYGLLRQNYWHPLLDFGSKQNISNFSVKVKLPTDYHLTTSFPQSDKIQDSTKVIYAQSTYPTSDVALAYDKEWKVEKRRHKTMTVEIFATSEYRPSKEDLYQQLTEIYDILSSKFGKPRGDYLGVIQSRALSNSGWLARTNDIIISRENGEYNLMAKPWPRAIVAHEVSHAWTHPDGPAKLFLIEGWATFIESYFLQQVYADSVVDLFWQKEKEAYLNGNYEGQVSLWEDATNSGVSYYKGAWVFKILQNLLGQEVFEKGLRYYMQNSITKDDDIYAFSESLSAAAGFNIWNILETWLKSDYIPEVKAYIQNDYLIVEQLKDEFHFPLEIQLNTEDEIFTDTYIVKERINKFPIKTDSNSIKTIIIDPHQQMLVKVDKDSEVAK